MLSCNASTQDSSLAFVLHAHSLNACSARHSTPQQRGPWCPTMFSMAVVPASTIRSPHVSASPYLALMGSSRRLALSRLVLSSQAPSGPKRMRAPVVAWQSVDSAECASQSSVRSKQRHGMHTSLAGVVCWCYSRNKCKVAKAKDGKARHCDGRDKILGFN